MMFVFKKPTPGAFKKIILVFAIFVAIGVAIGLWIYRAEVFGLDTSAKGPAGVGMGGGGWGMRGGPGGAGGRVQPVSAGVVKQMDIRVIVNALGNMAALNTATVRAKVDAELKAIHFKEGQIVKAGQLLVDLDTQNLDAQVTQAQGQFDRDNAQYKNAVIDLQRYKELLSKDAIAVQQVDTQDALVRQLKGTVLADQGTLDNARLQLSYAHVVAPISGRLGLKQVELGSLVRSGDVNGIVSITQFQPIAAVFAVPEKYVPTIQKKLHQNEPLPVEVWDAEMSKILGKGRVSLTDNAIDASTGTLKLKALLENKDEALFPNQFANIKLQLDVLKNAITVPSAAVQRGAVGTFVYVINEESKVSTRPVKLLALDGDAQAVEGNLTPGERVVLDGADRLRDQSKVEVVKTTDAKGQTFMGTAAPTTPNSADQKAKSQVKSDSSASPLPLPSPNTSGSNGSNSSNNSNSSVVGSAVGSANTNPPNANSAGAPANEANNNGGEDGGRRRWMERLPPEVVEKVKAMSPEERKAFFQKMRERRRQEQGE